MALADAVRRALDAGVVVVVSTRIASGPVDAAYGGGGGAADLVATGALLSRRLRPGQARIVLLALLGSLTNALLGLVEKKLLRRWA